MTRSPDNDPTTRRLFGQADELNSYINDVTSRLAEALDPATRQLRAGIADTVAGPVLAGLRTSVSESLTSVLERQRPNMTLPRQVDELYGARMAASRVVEAALATRNLHGPAGRPIASALTAHMNGTAPVRGVAHEMSKQFADVLGPTRKWAMQQADLFGVAGDRWPHNLSRWSGLAAWRPQSDAIAKMLSTPIPVDAAGPLPWRSSRLGAVDVLERRHGDHPLTTSVAAAYPDLDLASAGADAEGVVEHLACTRCAHVVRRGVWQFRLTLIAAVSGLVTCLVTVAWAASDPNVQKMAIRLAGDLEEIVRALAESARR